ncbi:MAG: terminase large subunit [Pseudomonadota bacterium]
MSTPTPATEAIRFVQTLRIPEGPKAGDAVKLAGFQCRFVKGALKRGVQIGVLSVGRGNGKTALSAGLALAELLGVIGSQPRRDVLLAARTRDQARIAWNFVAGFAQSLPDETQARLRFRRSPRLEIEYEADDGPHLLRAISADGKNVLGTAPTLALMDERGHWPADRGDALEDGIVSGLGKRGGRALIISTSASDDAHAFSRWIDSPPPGTFVSEYRPEPGLPADDLESLLLANPGAKSGIGSPPKWLQAQAERAIAQGGHALTSFRLYNRNERISGEVRDVLLTVDEWLAAEADTPPPRSGPVVVGIDLGGSASMTAAALYWSGTGRLEVHGWFPRNPSLLDRGQTDGVARRYVEMADRGELSTLGDKTVPVSAWLAETMRRVQGETIAAVVADRYKQAELSEAMQAAGVLAPVVWRGMGFRDGGEDVERFRRAVFDGDVRCAPSLLMRSALADAVCLRDPAGNAKLAKARSKGRIDAASAAVLAVAEGARMRARPSAKAPRMVWA